MEMNQINATQQVQVKNHTTFEIGQGATYCMYSDRVPGTVIEVKGNTVIWREDNAKLLNGVDSGAPDALKFFEGGFVGHTSGEQRYEYSANPDGREYAFTLRKNGHWVKKGEGMRAGDCLVNGRRKYYDYNF